MTPATDVRGWGLRPKLVAILLLPTLAAVLLGALRLQSDLKVGVTNERLETLVNTASDAAALVHGLQAERDLTAGFAGKSPRSLAALGNKPADVDRAAAKLRASLQTLPGSTTASLQPTIRTALGGLNRLAGLRKSATAAQTEPAAVFRDYTTIIDSLLALVRETSAEGRDSGLANQVFALESLVAAKESASRQRATLYGALKSNRLSDPAYADLVAARARLAGGVAGYLEHSSTSQRQRYRSTVRGSGVTLVEQVAAGAVGRRPIHGLGISADRWFAVASQQIDQIRRVEVRQLSAIAAQVRALRAEARDAAVTSATIICLILGFALLATLVVARSVLRPLRILRTTALDVAQRRLPETVRRLQEGEEPDVDVTVQPVRVASRGELGQVARAFDAVHSQAVRLAGEQAMVRGSVNAMFVNLSRRSQTLVERQLRLIDELESSEQDPDRLASLFQLDHLATRMRRNDENLLVLAGAQGGRRRNQPVPLVDVLRAASAEVEQYSRVQVDVQPGHELAGRAVNDAVHLIAELLENATTFSPPHAPVKVRALALGGKRDVLVEIEDEGIGMAPDELERANEKLASPTVVSVSTARMMGLFVVARLALRQGIQVQLRASAHGGVTAVVRLPAAIVLPAAAQPEPEPSPPLRLIPEPSPRPALETSPARAGRNDDFDRLVSPLMGELGNRTASDPLGDFDLARTFDSDAGEPGPSPIFDALQSEWFRPVLPDMLPGSRDPATAGEARTEPPAPTWNSPGDEGWRAVAAMGTQPTGGVTGAGLPLRVPGRNLVPGAAGSSPAGRAPSYRAPEQARTLSNYQQGIGRARAAGDAAIGDRPDPTDRASSEESS